MDRRTLNEARQLIHFQLLNLRNIFNIISSDKFEVIFEHATDDEREKIWKYLEDKNKIGLATCLRKLGRESLETMTVRDLRMLAQEYGISGYNILPKFSLLSAIKSKENYYEYVSNPDTDGGTSIKDKIIGN